MRRCVARLMPLVPVVLLLAACSSIPISETDLGEWAQEVAHEGTLKLGGCVVADLDPNHEGPEIAAVRTDGAVLLVQREPEGAAASGGGWSTRRIADLPGEAIQCAAGELLESVPGLELVTVGAAVGGEDDGGAGAAWLISQADGFAPQKIFESERLLHAVVVGDLDPRRPGNEVLVAGYDAKAWLLFFDGARWDSLEVGDLRGQAKGAAVGRGGVIIVQADGTLSLVRRDFDGLWDTETVLEHPAPLARVAGTEDRVLFCSNDGALRHIGRGIPETVLEADDRLRGAVIADLIPLSGVEVATAGYDGTLRVAWKARTGWQSGVVGRDDGRFHHLATGRFPGLGQALVGCGYSGRIIVAHRITSRASQ